MALHRALLIDGPDLAEARRRELDIPRERAASLGFSAACAAHEGCYLREDGTRVAWADAVTAAVVACRSIPPDLPLPAPRERIDAETTVTIANETTLGAARRLMERDLRPAALNMANGVHPGGGFLGGARAQEEALCRSSALHATLRDDPMYAAHRRRGDHESSDWVIVSPDVPVFRDDDGRTLSEPWPCSFLTCAAPYAPHVGQPRSAQLLARRIERLLHVAEAHAFDALVLGAWGCGAFGNDARLAAADFHRLLSGPFDGAFREVVFAISDWSPERRFLGPFRDRFCGIPSGTGLRD